MKKSRLYIALMFIAISCAVSCSKPDEATRMVPADATIVVHVNAESLSSKLSWKEIQETTWFNELNAGATDSLSKALLQDPANSGIDTDGDLIFFLTKAGNRSILALQGKIGNASAFEAFNKKMANGSAVTKSGDLNSVAIANRGVVTWNDKRFSYVADADMPSASQMNYGGDGEAQAGPLSADSLRTINASLFALKGDGSLGSNKKFASLMKEAGDVHFWTNSETLLADMGGGVMSMMRVNVLFKGNVSATTFNFEDGKIAIKSRQYYGEEMTDLIEKYSPKDISSDVFNRIPSQNVVGMFAMNYPPEGLKEFVKLIGVDGMVNAYLGEAGYSIDEFIKANKGDVLLAVTDLSMQEKTMSYEGADGEPMTYTSRTPDLKFLFSTSINDKAAFDKLVGKLQAKIPAEATEQIAGKITYKLDNNWFVMSNSPEYANNFLTAKGNKQPFTDKISGHPYAGYIDIQKIIAAGGGPKGDSSSQSLVDASMRMWQDVIFYGGEIKDGAMVSEGQINLVDKSTNSLKQLNKYADLMAKQYKESKKNVYVQEEAVDSVEVVPSQE